MSTLKLFRYNTGAPRATGEDTTVLAQFLESDIQDDPDAARELLKRIKAARQGEDPQEFCGNSFDLSMDKRQATIHCHAMEDDTPTILKLKTVKKAVKNWLKFIRSPEKS